MARTRKTSAALAASAGLVRIGKRRAAVEKAIPVAAGLEASISLPRRRAFIHPAEASIRSKVLVVPEEITDLKSLCEWAIEKMGAAEFLSQEGWMPLSHLDKSLELVELPSEFDAHFCRPKDKSDDTSDWGNEDALRTAPSSINNKVAMKLQGVDPTTGESLGTKAAFYNYRPVSATPPLPLTLAHPAFGTFWDIFHGIGTQPSREDYNFFLTMALKLSRFYGEEADYRDEVAHLWKSYTGVTFVSELNAGGGTQCGLAARNRQRRAMFASLESKLGTFSSKSDPGFQSAQYLRLYWNRKGDLSGFYNSCYPAIAIEHLGASIRVNAVALLDRFCCMPLTPSVNVLAIQGHDLEAAKQGARLCLAVKSALLELEAFYAEFRGGPPRDLFFRKCIAYPMHNCQTPPARFEDKLVYLVREPNKPRTVVKFVQWPYGEDVHRAWAAAGYAPQLHQVSRLPGGWWQVTMEHLGKGWKTLQSYADDADDMRPLVLDVLAKAHQVTVNAWGQVGVHGDMRDVNVMVCRSKHEEVKVKFIDFDWARPQGSQSACYPPFMNYLQVDWTEGVEESEPMLQRHDRELLSKKQADQVRNTDFTF